MRKNLTVVLALVVLLVVPAGVSAQGWLGGLFGSTGPGTACGASCEPGCPGLLKFDLGYLFGDRGAKTGVSFNGNLFADVNSDDFQWRVQGLQLGATLQAPLKDDFGLRLRGTWLIPDSGRAIEVFNEPGTGPTTLRWSTAIQNYTLEGAAVYAICTPCHVLAGFRFDSLFTNLKNPVHPELAFSVPADRAEWTINEYIPYVGVGVNYGHTARLSFIGTPILWGDTKSRLTFGIATPVSQEFKATFRNGYFFEAAVEYGLDCGIGTASLLAKWTYLHATGSCTVHGNEPGAPNVDLSKASVDLIRQNALLAAQFSVPFVSPW